MMALVVSIPALAAALDLTRAEQLVREGKYQETYDLLAPFEDARKGDATFNYLFGRAYFALGRYAEAKIEFETVLRFDNLPPDLLTQVETYVSSRRRVRSRSSGRCTTLKVRRWTSFPDRRSPSANRRGLVSRPRRRIEGGEDGS